MNRAVYIGGFSGGRRSVQQVKEALLDTNRYSCVTPFTFATAMRCLPVIEKLAENNVVITHSAGMLAVAKAFPAEIHAFAPPIPTSVNQLLGATAIKTLQMHATMKVLGNERAVVEYDVGSLTELASRPRANFGRLPQIAAFDAIDVAIALQEQGTETTLIYGSNDTYFIPTAAQRNAASCSGVTIVEIPGGVHDDLVLNPPKVLKKYFG